MARFDLLWPPFSNLYEFFTSFVKLAESYGHVGIQISTPDELERKIKKPSVLKINWSLLILTLMKPNTFTQCKVRGGAMNEMILSKPQEEKE